MELILTPHWGKPCQTLITPRSFTIQGIQSLSMLDAERCNLAVKAFITRRIKLFEQMMMQPSSTESGMVQSICSRECTTTPTSELWSDSQGRYIELSTSKSNTEAVASVSRKYGPSCACLIPPATSQRRKECHRYWCFWIRTCMSPHRCQRCSG